VTVKEKLERTERQLDLAVQIITELLWAADVTVIKARALRLVAEIKELRK
jgi:hypothetical protein